MSADTDPRPSLAELRSENAATMDDHANRRHGGEESATCKVCRHLHAVNTVLDIVEAAQRLDTALLHDAVAGVEAKLTLEELDEALAKVRA